MKQSLLILAVGSLLLASFIVRASPDHPGPPPIGFEDLDGGKVWHIWNELDDYYFNSSSGIQLTNHYNQYWSHNVFCGAIKLDDWIYKCTDSLPFNWSSSMDNSTYVNISGFKEINFTKNGNDYRLRFRLTYHLELQDRNLTVIPYIENIGSSDIPVDLGFAWIIKDIRISNTPENDYLEINGTSYLLNQSLDNSYSNLQYAGYSISDFITGEFLFLKWDENLNYVLKVKSVPNQYNAPVALAINIGTLPAGSIKTTKFYWKDALCNISTCSLDAPTSNQVLNLGQTFGMSTRVVSNCPPTKLRTLTEQYGNQSGGGYFTINGSTELRRSLGTNPESDYEDFTNSITVQANAVGNYLIRGQCTVEGAGTAYTSTKQVNVTPPINCLINTTTQSTKLSKNYTQCFDIAADNIMFDCAGNWLVGSQYETQYAIMTTNRKNLTVKNCFFTNHTRGISFLGANNSLIFNNSFQGIRWIKSNTSMTIPIAAIYLSGGYGNRIESNNISNTNATQLGVGTAGYCGEVIAYGIGAINTKSLSISNNSIINTFAYELDPDDALGCNQPRNEGYGLRFESSTNMNVFNISIKDSNSYDFQAYYANASLNDSSLGSTSIILDSDIFYVNNTFNRSAITEAGGNSNLTIQWYVRVNVTDANGTALQATVNITSRFGKHQMFDISGADGLTKPQAVTESVISIGAELSHNPHLIVVNKTGFATDFRYVNITNSTTIKIVLGGVVTDENTARQAILEGVNNTIPNATVYADQQLYVVNQLSAQSTGAFDDAAVLGNQTWGFNYLTGNETIANVSGLFTVVNVWERTGLSYSQIVQQVQELISSTRQ